MTSPLPQALDLLLGATIRPIRVERQVPKLSREGLPPVFSLSPSPTVVEQLKREGYDRLRYFVALPSLRMPRLLLPIDNASGMIGGAEIYFPHRWVPRTLKSMFLKIAKLGCVGWLRPRVLLASKGPLRLEALVHAVAGEQHPVFAFSFGRQAAVRKLTVQVMRPLAVNHTKRGRVQTLHEVLGYMKLPLTDMAWKRVRHEADTLERLWNFLPLRKHIPRLLYAGDWNDTFVLFQSPLEGTLGPTRLNGSHSEFLRALGNVHRVEKPGKALINKVAATWEKVAPMFGTQWNELGREVLGHATRVIGDKILSLGVMHGDFAPWNTRMRGKELLLFDWESADWEAPSTWDISHFEVLTASSQLTNDRHAIIGVPSEKACFMLYLLNSVFQYVQEGNSSAVRYRQELLIDQLQRN